MVSFIGRDILSLKDFERAEFFAFLKCVTCCGNMPQTGATPTCSGKRPC